MLVLCNLKPRNMRGIKSAGMLLAASNEEHTAVEPLSPAEGAAPGQRIWFGEADAGGGQAAPLEPNALAKKGCWEEVQPLLRTDGGCVAACGALVMRSASGPVCAASLAGARIA